MQHVDSLIAARWIIPIEPHGSVLDHHVVAIHHGRIVAVLPEKQARERFSADQWIERRTHVLIPGLVNTHTRAAMSLLRGAAESANAGHWQRHQIQPLEQRWLDADYVRDGTELAIADMLTSGTTCFADTHLFPEATAQVVAGTRMRACIGLPVLEQSTVWAESADECMDRGLLLHDEYRDDPLITTMLAPSAPGTVSDATLARVRRAADELELPVTMRLNQHAADMPTVGERALARLERLGLLSPLLLAAHMIHIDVSDIERAAAGGISIAHCPQANLKLGNGVCPVPALRAQGIALTLGTDGAACNNDMDMLDEMRTAALLANGVRHAHLDDAPEADAEDSREDNEAHNDIPPLAAHDWLQIATLNGARALGLGDAVGSLIPGKWADICCMDLARANTQPVYDVAAQIVYSASRAQVVDVWVAGRALLTRGQLTYIDLDDVLHRAQRWQQRISTGGFT